MSLWKGCMWPSREIGLQGCRGPDWQNTQSQACTLGFHVRWVFMHDCGGDIQVLACVADGADARALAWQLLPSAGGSAWAALDPRPFALAAACARDEAPSSGWSGPASAAGAGLGHDVGSAARWSAGQPVWAAAAAAAKATGGADGAQARFCQPRCGFHEQSGEESGLPFACERWVPVVQNIAGRRAAPSRRVVTVGCPLPVAGAGAS